MTPGLIIAFPPPENPDEASLLVVEGLSFRAGPRTLGPISLRVGRGEIVGVLGPNGAGKHALLRAIAGETKITGGKISVGPVAVTGLSKSQRQKAGMHVCLRERRRWGANRSMLEMVAAAIASGPKVLLIDEPFDALTAPVTRSAMVAILKTCRDAGLGVLTTDSEVREALNLVDRAYLVSEGKVVAEGTPEYLVSDKNDFAPPPPDSF